MDNKIRALSGDLKRIKQYKTKAYSIRRKILKKEANTIRRREGKAIISEIIN